MNQVKLLIISALLLFCFSCKTNEKSEKKEGNTTLKLVNLKNKPTIQEKKVKKLKEVKSSGLEGKKFYFLSKDKEAELILEKYPQYPGDFEMKKYIFRKDVFIDGDNVMEPSEWNVLKIFKRDSVMRYILSMKGNNELIDTLNLIYSVNKGLLRHNIKDNSIILIDSIKSNNIKTVNRYFEDD